MKQDLYVVFRLPWENNTKYHSAFRLRSPDGSIRLIIQAKIRFILHTTMEYGAVDTIQGKALYDSGL